MGEGGGVGPRLYCDSLGHAHRIKTCMVVDQPFLQLHAKFQLCTSSQKFFRDISLLTIDVPRTIDGGK